jgi:hypothetical protein
MIIVPRSAILTNGWMTVERPRGRVPNMREIEMDTMWQMPSNCGLSILGKKKAVGILAGRDLIVLGQEPCIVLPCLYLLLPIGVSTLAVAQVNSPDEVKIIHSDTATQIRAKQDNKPKVTQ